MTTSAHREQQLRAVQERLARFLRETTDHHAGRLRLLSEAADQVEGMLQAEVRGQLFADADHARRGGEV